MPRIRKKTSNRSTTNDRKKITQKVRETKKKKAKAAKKNPQWKSKHKKDPGIPNNFPYKDQILAEVAEQRRQAEEEKQKRKEEKRARKHLFKATAAEKQSEPEHEDAESDEDETPLLFSPDLPDLKSVLDSFLENWISDKPEKRILFLLNKIDSCPREAISAWLSTLRGDNPTLPFRSSSAFLPSEPSVNPKIKGKVVPKQTADAIGRDAVLSCLQQWGKEGHLTVAVVGPTNTGKSSFINSLLGKSTFPTCTSPLLSDARPSTTTQALEATLQVGSSSIRIIDTPGFLWKQNESTKSESIRARDILLRSKGRIDRLKDPIPVVSQIVERSTPEDLMLLYNLPAFSRGNSSSFLSGLARAQQLVMKHGKLDLTGASRIVLRDWSTGKFPRYTLPATAAKETSSRASELANLYATELDILASLPTHKEMRKGRGVVKMSPGEVDSREVQIDAPWVQDDPSDSEQDEDIGGEMAEEDTVDTEDPPLESDSGSTERRTRTGTGTRKNYPRRRLRRSASAQRSYSFTLSMAGPTEIPLAQAQFLRVLSSATISGQPGGQISAVVGVLSMLFEHKHRFRSLRLHLPSGSLSALQALQNGPLNLLGSLDIETVGTDVSPPLDLTSVDVNWTRFTTLRLDTYPRITVDDCHRVLSKATSMKSCIMTVEGSHMPRVEPYVSITLSNLQTLQLRFTNSSPGFASHSFAGLLGSLHLPRLSNLDVACLFDYDSYSESDFLRELKSLLLRSSQSLTTLSLTNAHYTDEELLAILRETPRVSDLSLKFPLRAGDDPISEEFIRTFISTSKGQSLCPHLANLHDFLEGLASWQGGGAPFIRLVLCKGSD
ncbi:hypothetical protein EYR36_011431 [Pleurotus pulmonarius]|nr:hypothetical protein EYR36_011431 [Pleurotus pulmonarius]